MTPPDKDPNTPKTPDENTGEESGETTIEDTKQQLAEAYLDFLDKQKGGVLYYHNGKDALEYLTTETTGKDKKDILGTFLKNVTNRSIEKISGGTVMEYDKASLAKMKALITQYKNDQTKLQELMAQIQAGTDPTVTEIITPTKSKTTTEVVATGAVVAGATAVESAEKMSDRRKAVINNIHAIIAQDQKKNIDYQWGGKTKTSDGLDCSGLINYVIIHAGLDIGGDSRTLFQQFPTTKLELTDNKSISNDVSNIKEGDVIFWNSVKPGFTWPTHGTPPPVEKDGKLYCIHHVAFIKNINKEKGTVDVVQSSGGGVNEATINVSDVASHQNELYVAQVDYEKLSTMSQAKLAQLETLPGAATVA